MPVLAISARAFSESPSSFESPQGLVDQALRTLSSSCHAAASNDVDQLERQARRSGGQQPESIARNAAVRRSADQSADRFAMQTAGPIALHEVSSFSAPAFSP